MNIGKPPDNITPDVLFDKITSRLDEILKKSKTDPIGKPLFAPTKTLDLRQWKSLEALQRKLDDEYNLRRQMLITRLDVTIQSFQVISYFILLSFQCRSLIILF